MYNFLIITVVLLHNINKCIFEFKIPYNIDILISDCKLAWEVGIGH